MNVIISGGGTGGHIYPAIAIANELKAMDPTTNILFVGAEGKMEMEKVPRAGYSIVGLPVVGIKRELTLDNLAFPLKLGRSLIKAQQIVRDFRPDVAVGVGGYASGPLLLAASLKGIPALIQEQNSYAGLTNKVLARWAERICVAYPGMEAFFPAEKIRMTGNPVRKDIQFADQQLDAGLTLFDLEGNRPTVLVIGGSQGARTLNESMEPALQRFVDAGVQVVWQTGPAFIERARAAVAAVNSPLVKAYDFIYDMDKAYAVASVVVSRAGALSVSELCLVGRPAILVPFPAASEDHQTKNAMSLVERNAALLVRDQAARSELITTTLNLLNDAAKRTQLSTQIRTLARPNAAREIAEEVIKLKK
ncbi:UDP-N-acetylglucosamine--N-acetylmuramyl-(pentapeptide) pyrophosphoryl-undecaprenol N-acetylglucosamine transferase [Fibrisoma limi BUZ 3]|uniref:UDP-N-acetylglucosamine--N-acetylmuramyl-(pentapeptide) pyrophosphoryl-undecaprenol N-acetylglucosamine transferase n=1 Tax=Fibrisoma limi BUZ 3 TaxID=1185876 RepID=I2GQ63_9BACT|nr:undecaprenyldiphospho-muramoylpentapeptide beta-N-acetylglucosaminyltransferase [Fibrisoma limi]CCH56041.1 UDP-N-acetylglucosamine--N-acetylmuramyl-(pentapeptide) pyrophosphoryl-undecaprenol N-acetylglucosamine transferase [Fibrisoma limi BUZ 3]